MKVCDICFENQINFWTCDVCRNSHCVDCFGRILRMVDARCPFCRSDIVFDDEVRTPRFSFDGDKYLQFLFRNVLIN
jgi:hypothetical protein